MGKHYFSLEDGYMEVYDDCILINDEASKRRTSKIVLLGTMILVALGKFVFAYRKHDQDEMIFGLVYVGIVSFAVLFRYQDFYTVPKQLLMRDIESAKFVYHSFSRQHAVIFRLKNKRVRSVYLSVNRQEDINLKTLLKNSGIQLVERP